MEVDGKMNPIGIWDDSALCNQADHPLNWNWYEYCDLLLLGKLRKNLLRGLSSVDVVHVVHFSALLISFV